MNSKKAKAPRADLVRDRSRPDNACPECGKPLRLRHATLKYPINGAEIPVDRCEHSKCAA